MLYNLSIDNSYGHLNLYVLYNLFPCYLWIYIVVISKNICCFLLIGKSVAYNCLNTPLLSLMFGWLWFLFSNQVNADQQVVFYNYHRCTVCGFISCNTILLPLYIIHTVKVNNTWLLAGEVLMKSNSNRLLYTV